MKGPCSTTARFRALVVVPVRKLTGLWRWGRCWINIHVAIVDLLERNCAELAVTFAELCNSPGTLLLTILRARARAPMRPSAQRTVDVGLAAVRVAREDLDVLTLCWYTAGVCFGGDFASAPLEPTPAWSIALPKAAPFSP